MRPETIELLRLGAAYHEVGYQTYLQWLVERGLQDEFKYYGWASLSKRYTQRSDPAVEPDVRKGIFHKIRIAKRQRRRRQTPIGPKPDGPPPSS